MNRRLPVSILTSSFLQTTSTFPRPLISTRNSSDVIVRSQRKGRSGVSGVIATVFGASGYLGSALVNSLAQTGSQIILPFRGQLRSVHKLKVAGDLGQLVPMKMEIRDYESILRTIAESKVVINCIGRWNDTSHFTSADANVATAAVIAKACAEIGVEKLIHVSAYGASPDSPSEFARQKFQSEEQVRHYFPEATIFRPTTIYGVEDRFFSRNSLVVLLNKNKKKTHVLHPLETQIAPLHVVDAVDGVMAIIASNDSPGSTYHLLGPKVFQYSELLRVIEEASFTLPQNYISYTKSEVEFRYSTRPGLLVSKNPDWAPLEVEYINTSNPDDTNVKDSVNVKGLLTRPLITVEESADAILKPLRDLSWWNVADDEGYNFNLDSQNIRR